jgi:hypothetical protein
MSSGPRKRLRSAAPPQLLPSPLPSSWCDNYSVNTNVVGDALLKLPWSLVIPGTPPCRPRPSRTCMPCVSRRPSRPCRSTPRRKRPSSIACAPPSSQRPRPRPSPSPRCRRKVLLLQPTRHFQRPLLARRRRGALCRATSTVRWVSWTTRHIRLLLLLRQSRHSSCAQSSSRPRLRPHPRQRLRLQGRR